MIVILLLLKLNPIVYMIVILFLLELNPRIDDMLYICLEFFLQVVVWVHFLPSHTLLLLHIMIETGYEKT